MKPIDFYKSGRIRAEHLLKLAELLTNTRERKMRKDWGQKFKGLMHWTKKEVIDRVDGTGALLILRETSGVTAAHFEDEYLSELLRASLVGIVAAVDRYCHELVCQRVIKQLKRPSKASGELRRVTLPLLVATTAISHGKKKGTRPMNIIKSCLQDQFHRSTFQRSDDIARALRIIGVTNLWPRCATRLGTTSQEIETKLNSIVDHRNRIVHEGDIFRRKRGGKISYHPITPKQVTKDIIWISDLVDAIDAIVAP